MYDVMKCEACLQWGEYVSLDQLFAESDIITLHCPLNESTRHMVSDDSIPKMKPGVMLVNTSRGALVDTSALITGLKSRQIGSVALDVYEEEEGVFFEDLSGQFLVDDELSLLLNFPNVLITSHQAFLTHEALYQTSGILPHQVAPAISNSRKRPLPLEHQYPGRPPA